MESIDEFKNDLIDLMENAFKGWLEIYIRVVESKDFKTENSRIDEKVKFFLGRLGIKVRNGGDNSIKDLAKISGPQVSKSSTLRKHLEAHSKGI